MVRTKTSPRKSTGGKAPRRRLFRKDITANRPLHFEDHAGGTYTVVRDFRGAYRGIDKLGTQLYCLGSPRPSPEALGDSFVNCPAINDSGDRGMPRVDVYSNFSTIEECVEHHRREKAFRKQAVQDMRQRAVAGLSEEDAHEKLISEVRGKEPFPHIVPTWCASANFWREYHTQDRYRSWIYVMPEGCLSWDDVLEKGLLQVQFDLDVTPAMETETWDEDVEEDTHLDNDKYGWVFVDRSGLEKCKPVKRTLLCCRKRPHNAFFGFDHQELPFDLDRFNELENGWKTPGNEGTLGEAWSKATLAFWDCTYRRPSCDGCGDDVPHDSCEVELDEHYFDEDAQCIACRRVTDYRRRSKRIAARNQK
ncbi:hypothetical protein AK830_g10659 [Neonectria ditissima]|uniref:Uncharacterized protein n=1 Tax=Neonectria ditissima TaxID=78410 RepID=A0A0P7B604_9HYPO|nr:hypothetical protein AK830_g10659 [Neonectria ditissima]